jgi:hypothetical protein
MTDQLPAIPPARVSRMLTAAEFQELADVPPEFEWFANITNAGTRRVYEKATKDFMRFVGIVKPEEFRILTPAHIIAWRDDLMARGLAGVTIRRHLATLSSLSGVIALSSPPVVRLRIGRNSAPFSSVPWPASSRYSWMMALVPGCSST